MRKLCRKVSSFFCSPILEYQSSLSRFVTSVLFYQSSIPSAYSNSFSPSSLQPAAIMPVLEFATVTLNASVIPTDEGLLSVLRACLSSITLAKGVSGFRWIQTSPDDQGQKEPILALLGIWATVEDHEDFVQSGQMTPLLADLKDFIQIKDVVHLAIPTLTSAEHDVLGTGFVCAIIRVKSAKHEQLETLVTETVRDKYAKTEIITGWKVKKEKSFDNAVKFGKERLGQGGEDIDVVEKEEEEEEEDVWALFVKQEDGALVDDLVRKSEALTKGTEVSTWTTMCE